MVAVRGLIRSLHSNFGFEPRNTMLAGVNLASAGYTIDQVPTMQRRMIDAMKTIPGVDAAGLVNGYPPLVYTAGTKVSVFKEETSDLKAAKADIMPFRYDISPGYFDAAGTSLLSRFCRNDIWLRYECGRQRIQAAGWDACSGGGGGRKRKIPGPH
jgi:hypothetical protein